MNDQEFDKILRVLDLVKSATSGQLCTNWVGSVVLVRSGGSGVWIGTLEGREKSAAGTTVHLTNARRIWSWKGAAECSQLALEGPREGNIGMVCSPLVHDVLEEHLASPACVSAIASIPEWKA